MIIIKYDNLTGEILSVLNVTRLEDALAAVRSGREELVPGSAEAIDTATHYVADGALRRRPDPPPLDAADVATTVGAPTVIAQGLPDGTICSFRGVPGAPEAALQDGIATLVPSVVGVWTAEIAPPWPQQAALCRIVVSAGA